MDFFFYRNPEKIFKTSSGALSKIKTYHTFTLFKRFFFGICPGNYSRNIVKNVCRSFSRNFSMNSSRNASKNFKDLPQEFFLIAFKFCYKIHKVLLHLVYSKKFSRICASICLLVFLLISMTNPVVGVTPLTELR